MLGIAATGVNRGAWTRELRAMRREVAGVREEAQDRAATCTPREIDRFIIAEDVR